MRMCSNCGRESAAAASFCQFCGNAFEPSTPVQEQRKIVTVVFTDVTGSTSLGERLDPETLRGVMSRYFEAMRAVIERHGGTVEKFIGDAVMAVFGVPKAHEDDAMRAVRAAAEMRDALAALNADLRADRGVEIDARTGVHTGEVIAGNAAARERFVSGDTVNVAARLEQAAAPGEILLGSTTQALVRDATTTEPLEPLELKGKAEPVGAFRLLAVHADAAGRTRHLDAPMIGRERQLRMLSGALDAAIADSTCTLFTVLGAPGVGKTRLVEEFLRLADASVHRGRCLSYGEGITFRPVDEIVRSISGGRDLGEVTMLHDLREILRGADEPDAILAKLSGMLELTEEPVALQDGFWAFRKLLEHVAATRPLIVLIDDIHWAEPTMLDLIEHVADWSREAPIALLCTARPELLEVRPNWGGGKSNATSTLLEPLSAAESALLIENVLAGSLPEGVRDRVIESAEGNPLFVEEMLGMLIDDGSLRRGEDRWEATGELADVTVPATIQALIGARLDRLAPGERTVIERGAVEGRVFHVGGVTALTPELDSGSLHQRLMTLVRRELIRPDRAEFAGDEAFRFRHLLIRDAAYESMPKEVRAELHERFAAWLMARAAEAAGSIDAVVAHHFDQAHRLLQELGVGGPRVDELAEEAGERYAAAGRAALTHGDAPAAVTLLERATALLVGDRSLQARLELGTAQLADGLFGPAEVTLTLVRSDARSGGDRRTELWAATRLLTVRDSVETNWSGARFVAESEALERGFDELGDDAGAVEAAMLRVTWIPRHEGVLLAQKAAERAARAGAPDQERRALNWAMRAGFWGVMPPDEGVRRCEELISRGDSNRYDQAEAWAGLAGNQAMLGRFDDARVALARAGTIVRELGIARSAFGAFTGTWIERFAGDAAASQAYTRRGVEDLLAIGEKSRLSTLAADLAWSCAKAGDEIEAERFLELARETATPDDTDTHSLAATAQSVLATRRGDHATAIADAERAVRLLEQRGSAWVEGMFLLTLADAREAAGDPAAARVALREALARFEAKGLLPMIAVAREHLTALGGTGT